MKESKRKEILKKPALILGLAFVALGCTLGIASFSWFCPPQTSAELKGVTGEAVGSYFESGDGSETNPYVIAKPQQLYYFAWLQDMGYFNEASTKTDSSGESKTQIWPTYFELSNDLDASGLVLPPCGTENYPFVGNFNAKNHTISNLTIASSIESGYIEKYPTRLDAKVSSGSDETGVTQFNSQAALVGFFGVIGEYTDNSLTYDSSANEVKNLYLDNLTIKTKKDNLLVGIFAGYVNGIIDNCGVHYAKMDIDGVTSKISKFSNVSRFTLIGDYNTSKYSYEQDVDSGSSDSGDEGYGTSIDVYSLYNKLNNSLSSTSNPLSLPDGYAVPIKFDSSASVVLGSGTTTVTSSGANMNVSNASTIPVDSKATNIGYYSGSLGAYKDHFSKDFSSISDAGNTVVKYNKSEYGESLTDEQKEKIQSYLAKTTATGKAGDNAIVLNGSSTFEGASGNEHNFPTDASAFTVVKNAQVGSWKGDLFIPRNGIWVAPIKPGRFEFIASGTKIRANILIVRLVRSSHGDYSTGFSNTTYQIKAAKASDEDDNPFETGMAGCTMSGSTNYYFGINISQKDIECGYEYFITADSGMPAAIFGYPVIFYVDIGTDASSGTTTEKTAITNFDFVTKDSSGTLTKIKNYDETTKTATANESYVMSQVSFKVGNTTQDTLLAFRRLEDAVYYYQSPAVLTLSDTGTKTQASKEDCTSA